jgi:hypothetical protein
MIVGQGNSHLFQIVATLRAPRSFACLLNGRKKQRYKNGDDGNHNKEIDQREARRSTKSLASISSVKESRFAGVVFLCRHVNVSAGMLDAM